MITIRAKIEGIYPLLTHRFGLAAEASLSVKTTKVTSKSKTPRDVAEEGAYRTAKGECAYTAWAFPKMLAEVGVNHKQRGSRKSLKYVIPSSVFIPAGEDLITLLDPVTGKPIMDFEIDSRSAVNQKTKGRVMSHRPRYERWAAYVLLEVDDTVLDEEIVHLLLTEGGLRQGIGSFRPQRGGPFGRFRVTEFKKM